jgi:hypothetical protein
MLRNIYTVSATQVITSDTHPEGVLSTLPNFPITVDSRTYPVPDGNPNGDSDTALVVAQAEYADEVKALTVANNPNRVMWCVTITDAKGVQIARKSWGAMPDMTPVPEPEVEPVETEVE